MGDPSPNKRVGLINCFFEPLESPIGSAWLPAHLPQLWTALRSDTADFYCHDVGGHPPMERRPRLRPHSEVSFLCYPLLLPADPPASQIGYFYHATDAAGDIAALKPQAHPRS